MPNFLRNPAENAVVGSYAESGSSSSSPGPSTDSNAAVTAATPEQ
jgi:hypothetical protein